MNFSPEKRLSLSYVLVTIIIFSLLGVSLFALSQSTSAIDQVIAQNRLVTLAKEGVINLTTAGQFPLAIGQETKDFHHIETEMQALRNDFVRLGEAMNMKSLPASQQEKVARFLKKGDHFYSALATFIPLRQDMLVYFTTYKGEMRLLSDVLLQRELNLISYVRALKRSIAEKNLRVGTFDYHDCGFFKWYSENPPMDEDLAEIITEEIHPLHVKLHNYAGQVNQWLSLKNAADSAPAFLEEAEKDLSLLGRYFTGVRLLTSERYSEAKEKYRGQFLDLQDIYGEAKAAADQLEAFLKDTVLADALASMQNTTRRSQAYIWIFSALATGLTLLIAKLTFTRISAWSKKLEQAYRDLQTTHAQMLQSEKMASIGQLAAGVAHEINNPMGFITSNLGTMDKYAERLTGFIQAQSELVSSIKESGILAQLQKKREKLKIDYIFEDMTDLIAESLDGADRIKHIVQSLKSFSRVDQAEETMADLNECLETTLKVVWNELKYKCTVDKEYGDIPKLLCFPQQLNQVFMNLLVNAAQAIEEQGQITIKTWCASQQIFVLIEDTGGGIPKDKIAQIFDPFFTTKPVGKGTGLGLSICYDIIKKHGGSITVDSQEGKGTTFVIRLPIRHEKKGND